MKLGRELLGERGAPELGEGDWSGDTAGGEARPPGPWL